MKLEAIKTADQLVMALVRHGYKQEQHWLSANASSPYYFYWEEKCDVCGFPHRGIRVYPTVLDHGDDYGIEAMIGRDGGVIEWAMVEHNAGTLQVMDPGLLTVEPESLGERLQAWVESWYHQR